MPRDCAPQAVGEVTVSGGRRGRVIETVVAGQYAIEVSSDWVARLASAGLLDHVQVEAAKVLMSLFETSGIRPHLAGAYDGCLVDGGSDAASPFERMTTAETRAWRRLGRLLSRCPAHCRAQVESVVLWDLRPSSIPHLRLGLREVARALGTRNR